MRILKTILFLLLSVSAHALTLTAIHRTMHVGDPVPPLTWIANGSLAACTGQPVITTTATPSSPVGTYPITISVGTFACTGLTLVFTGSTVDVITPDGIGAVINNGIQYPPGFFSGPTNPALDVTSNGICDMVPNSPGNATTNTSCFNTIAANYMGSSCSVAPTNVSFIYIPAGEYWVNGQLNPCGNGFTIFGKGPQASFFHLAPNSPTFNTGTNTQWWNPTSVATNQNFREFVFGIGFEVGYGNPNATAVTTEANNAGGFRDVIIWAEDSNCPIGFNLTRAFPGPGIAKNLAIYGCAAAVTTNQPEYSWTFDQITTEGQTASGIGGSGHYAVQHWLSDNTVTAFLGQGGSVPAHTSILDSELLNGNSANIGINNVTNGYNVYVRNVSLSGYNPSLSDLGTGTSTTRTGNIAEYWTGTAQCLFCSSIARSLNLPEQETPEPVDPPASSWQQLSTTINNWGTEISSPTSSTIYAAPGNYIGTAITVSITVPDTVNHINFYNALDKTSGGSGQEPKLNITVAGSSSTPLVIDGCIYAVCNFIHTGSRTLAIRDTYMNGYNLAGTVPSAGNLFLEDTVVVGGSNLNSVPNFSSGQSIWARQLNIENRTVPEMQCTGCTMWILGYKTENNPDQAPSSVCTAGGRFEEFGLFWYTLAATAGGTAAAYNTNCSGNLTGFMYNTISGRTWQYWVTEKQQGTTLNLPTTQPLSNNLNFYYSNFNLSCSLMLPSGSSLVDPSSGSLVCP